MTQASSPRHPLGYSQRWAAPSSCFQGQPTPHPPNKKKCPQLPTTGHLHIFLTTPTRHDFCWPRHLQVLGLRNFPHTPDTSDHLLHFHPGRDSAANGGTKSMPALQGHCKIDHNLANVRPFPQTLPHMHTAHLHLSPKQQPHSISHFTAWHTCILDLVEAYILATFETSSPPHRHN